MAEQIDRIQLGDGWTKDSSGQVYDPDGYKWYSSVVSAEQTTIETPPEASPLIQDTGTGDQKVLRTFQCKHPPGVEIPPGEEVWKAIQLFVQQGLFKSGLTTDDNYQPVIHQSNRLTVITVVCKPSGRRLTIYDGMKEGQEVANNIGGQFIKAVKTDNINTLLAPRAKKN